MSERRRTRDIPFALLIELPLVIMIAIALAACTPVEPPAPAAQKATPCDANVISMFKGQARADVEAQLPAGPLVRMIAPDQPVTEEYLEGRMNFILDGKDRVREVFCG